MCLVGWVAESLDGQAVNTTVSAVFVALVLVATSAWAAEDKATEQENSLLTLVLKRSYPDGGYTVVSPEARFEVDEIEKTKKHIMLFLDGHGVAVAKLVDRLFERNKKAVRLSIKSSPKDGYVMDNYFRDGGSWETWPRDHPRAHGFTTVSLPVYDQEAGLVLVYEGTQTAGLSGGGWVVLYKYEKGELKELSRARLWVS
jgi:hypothetical protein